MPSTVYCLLVVGGVALAVRLAFGFRAPPFVTNDSLSYLLPGFDLARGVDFAPILKRPPLYPLFIAGVIGLFGEEPRVLMLVQHLLGVVTSLLAFGIGRLLFGPAAGLLAGLLTALSGPLLVTEHYLMSETLFGTLLAAALFSFLIASGRAELATEEQPSSADRGVRSGWALQRASTLRHPTRRWSVVGWFAAAGVLLGLAALTRPIAQLALLLLLAALPLLIPRRRGVLLYAAAMLGCFALVVLPWMARNRAVQGTFAIAGGMGEGLAVRTIRYEQRFDFREPPGGDEDRLVGRARRIYRDEAGDGSAFELARRLRDELQVTEARADSLMRQIALGAILRQPGYYLVGTAEMFARTFVGRAVRLRQDWTPWRNIAWEPRVAHLLPSPTAAEERAFAAAETLATLYDPARLPYSALLPPLFALGMLSGLARRRRPALLLGLLVLCLLLAGAALIGVEWRYRYPLDPLINVLAGGGLVAVVAVARQAGAWRRDARRADLGRVGESV